MRFSNLPHLAAIGAIILVAAYGLRAMGGMVEF